LVDVEYDQRLVLPVALEELGQVRQAGELQHHQGSQFTSAVFTGTLAAAGIRGGLCLSSV